MFENGKLHIFRHVFSGIWSSFSRHTLINFFGEFLKIKNYTYFTMCSQVFGHHSADTLQVFRLDIVHCQGGTGPWAPSLNFDWQVGVDVWGGCLQQPVGCQGS